MKGARDISQGFMVGGGGGEIGWPGIKLLRREEYSKLNWKKLDPREANIANNTWQQQILFPTGYITPSSIFPLFIGGSPE